MIGNGIAGVTAADFIRRGHPDCEIHIVGQEPHALYNRMGISRLVYGRSAMQGLYLLPEQWYDEHGVTRGSTRWHAGSICARGRCCSAPGTRAVRPADPGDGRECGRAPRSSGSTGPAVSCCARRATRCGSAGTRSSTAAARPWSRAAGCSAWRPPTRCAARVERDGAGAGFAAAEQAGRCALLGVGRARTSQGRESKCCRGPRLQRFSVRHAVTRSCAEGRKQAALRHVSGRSRHSPERRAGARRGDSGRPWRACR